MMDDDSAQCSLAAVDLGGKGYPTLLSVIPVWVKPPSAGAMLVVPLTAGVCPRKERRRTT